MCRLDNRWVNATLVFAGYLVIFIITRQVFSLHSPHHLYTPEWTSRHVLWPAAAISTIPALFGLRRFPFIILAGYVLGVITGELFGGFQADVPPQYLHHGWLIWFCVFAASVGVGVAVEVRRRRRA